MMEREWDGRETRERREGGENMGGSTSELGFHLGVRLTIENRVFKKNDVVLDI